MDDSSFPHYLNFPFQSIFNCPYQKEIPTLLYLDIQPFCKIYMTVQIRFSTWTQILLKNSMTWKWCDWQHLHIFVHQNSLLIQNVYSDFSLFSTVSIFRYFLLFEDNKNVKRTEFYLFHYSLIQIKYIKWLTPLFHPLTPRSI